MKNYLLYLILPVFSLFGLAASGQNSFLNNAGSLDYIITNDDDTIQGDFIGLSLNLRYQFVEQYNVRKMNGKKEFFHINETKMLFFDDTAYYPMPSEADNPDGYYGWMNVMLENGSAKLYKHSYWEKTGQFSKETISLYYIYDGETFIMEIEDPDDGDEEELLKQYFEFCPDFLAAWEEEGWDEVEPFLFNYYEICVDSEE